MKILHVLSQYPDSTGSGIYLQAILRQAKEQQHINNLIVGINAGRVPDINKNIAADRVSLVEFNTPQLPFALPGMSDVMPYMSSRFQDLTTDQIQTYEKVFLHTIEKQIEEFSPDIIHSHHLWLLSSLLKNNFSNIPLVTSCHGSDLRQYQLCPHLRHRVQHGCARIDKVLALTNVQKDEIIKLYGFSEDTVAIVGAGYNDKIFSFSEKATPPPVHISYCGKLSRAKGVPWLIKAIHRLSSETVQLHLIGSSSGPEQSECMKLARHLGSQVTFHGAMSQEQLASHLRKSHIFILPSLYEGLPLAILEALACGCRVIATDIPGCRTIAEKLDGGLLTLIQPPRLHDVDSPLSEDEPGFIEGIGKSIEKAILLARQNPSLPQSVVKKNTRFFTWRNVFQEIEKSYSELLSHR